MTRMLFISLILLTACQREDGHTPYAVKIAGSGVRYAYKYSSSNGEVSDSVKRFGVPPLSVQYIAQSGDLIYLHMRNITGWVAGTIYVDGQKVAADTSMDQFTIQYRLP